MSEALLKELIAKVDALNAKINRIAGVAPEWKLDGEKGNPDIRFDPKAWRGESFKGMRFADASPDYLDILADAYEWSADNPKEGKEKYADNDRRTAALARGWSERKRSGWKAPARAAKPEARNGYGGGGGYGAAAGGYGASAAPQPGSYGGADDDIPFSSCDIAHDLRWSGML